MQLRNLAPETIRGYVYYVARFAKYFGRSPEQLTPEHARQYQLHLLQKKVSWSTFNQSVCALRFLYGTTLGRKDYVPRLPFGKRPKRIPVVLSREEVLKFLQGILSRKQRMLLTTMYATGMRVGEAVELSVNDIDSRLIWWPAAEQAATVPCPRSCSRNACSGRPSQSCVEPRPDRPASRVDRMRARVRAGLKRGNTCPAAHVRQ
jgi:site-specific recombinase XerD